MGKDMLNPETNKYEYCGFCRTCNKYYAIDDELAEKKAYKCPIHKTRVILDHGGSLETMKNKLALSPKSIGEGFAIL
jgi:hypothetical protein